MSAKGTCAFNLCLVMRKLYRARTPRALEALVRDLLHPRLELFSASTAASEFFRPAVLALGPERPTGLPSA